MVTHVSGNRMMAQRTNGVSGGSLKERMTVEKEILTFCPWEKSSLESNNKLLSLVKTWAPTLKPEVLFVQGYDIIGKYRDISRYSHSK